ncbi:MAG: FtsX-like permease family protein, partial [Candidatus Caenarcaniphilales bacterium]|nr:FtsX-like permease family protein [Candidatus Caenarcaniphilales bacterium]
IDQVELGSSEEQVFISSQLAKKLINKNHLRVRIAGKIKEIKYQVLKTDSAEFDNLILGDIRFIQKLLEQENMISYINILDSDQKLNKLASSLGPDLLCTSSASRSKTALQMISSFTLNLTALSLLAVLLAVFLIYNSISFSIVKRRKQLAILKAIGASDYDLSIMIIVEVLFLSMIGIAIGLLLGLLLGIKVNEFVLSTISDIYLSSEISRYEISFLMIAKSVVIALMASVFAALPAIYQVLNISPILAMSRHSLESSTKSQLYRLALVSLLAFSIAILLWQLPTKAIVIAFVILLLFLIAYLMSLPFLIVSFLDFALKYFSSFTLSNLSRNMSRILPAFLALTLALSIVVGLDLTISSFRKTVDKWLTDSLRADIYISNPRLVSTKIDSDLSPELVNEVKSFWQDKVNNIVSYKNTTLKTNYGLIQFASVNRQELVRELFSFKFQDFNSWKDFMTKNDVIFISEPLATRLSLKLNDTMELLVNKQKKLFKIKAIIYDYGTSEGIAYIPSPVYESLAGDSKISSLALFVNNKKLIDKYLDDFNQLIAGRYQLFIRTNKKLKDDSMQIFDNTFRVISVLKILTITVAVIAIIASFTALQMDRIREIAILQAIGFEQFTLMSIVIKELLFTAFFAALFSLPAAYIEAWMMVNVINLKSFGWSMPLIFDWSLIVEAFGLSLLAAILAAVVPCFNLFKINIAKALRYE